MRFTFFRPILICDTIQLRLILIKGLRTVHPTAGAQIVGVQLGKLCGEQRSEAPGF